MRRALLIAILATVGWLFVVHLAAQIDWNDRRITVIEAQNLDARVRVLENDMSEIILISRSVAIAVIGQFAIAAYSAIKKGRAI